MYTHEYVLDSGLLRAPDTRGLMSTLLFIFICTASTTMGVPQCSSVSRKHATKSNYTEIINLGLVSLKSTYKYVNYRCNNIFWHHWPDRDSGTCSNLFPSKFKYAKASRFMKFFGRSLSSLLARFSHWRAFSCTNSVGSMAMWLLRAPIFWSCLSFLREEGKEIRLQPTAHSSRSSLNSPISSGSTETGLWLRLR